MGWDNTNEFIDMDIKWWKKVKHVGIYSCTCTQCLCNLCVLPNRIVVTLVIMQEILGCGKYQKKALQNPEFLQEMSSDISNDESNYWNLLSENHIIPDIQR